MDIPKNKNINADWVRAHQSEMENLFEYYLAYPDLFIDAITPADSTFELYFYQRIFLRASLRYRYHYCVAPRAFSKSFVAVLAGFLRCMFLPRSKFFLCAPGKSQGVSIASEKINEILDLFPILEKELVKKNMSNDYVKLVFRNGATFEIIGALGSTRGERKHGGIIDEVRDHDAQVLTEIILPLMNVDRRTVRGELDPTEPNQQQIYITSAGQKGSYAYEKLVELFIQSIIAPNSTFVWGCDYRIPLLHGLLNKQYIEELKLSSTYRDDSFAKEYLSVWSGGSSESWMDYNKLFKYRKIINSERRQNLKGEKDIFYLISVDVARIGVLTSVQVFKVVPKDDFFQKRLVYSTSFHDAHFANQSIEIKKLKELYQPKEIVIDGTGLGVGLLDFLVMDQVDERGLYPALASFNDEEYKKFNGEKIMYVLKATPTINSDAHSNAFSQIANGHVRFLITEQEAKSKLLATKAGANMRPLDRIQRLTPYIECTRLLEEICNLKVRSSVENKISVEQISKRIAKDRFSAFEYGLWRIKEHEEKYFKKKRNRKVDFKRFVHFTKGVK